MLLLWNNSFYHFFRSDTLLPNELICRLFYTSKGNKLLKSLLNYFWKSVYLFPLHLCSFAMMKSKYEVNDVAHWKETIYAENNQNGCTKQMWNKIDNFDVMLLTFFIVISVGIVNFFLFFLLGTDLIFFNQIGDQDRLQKAHQHQSKNHNAIGC